jgi:hypothetical protein
MLNVNFYRNEPPYSVIASNYNNEDLILNMGTYSGKEKILKVLEMLHEVYDKGVFVPGGNYSPDDSNFVIVNEGYYKPCKVFQFPADDEIEV